ncbi:L-threonylcarbamoyladenylate synthase [Pseudahrensia aquimaris]|uniref:Threonylcarbamoyl-AMP synthase n=1 Tax=Pseudahrensia aquimaris TaxID=744461 RepID=A0ABW3FGC7_9HYPH
MVDCVPIEKGLRRAEDILREGGLVAVPTETVYGLAARADDTAAVARIYAAKGRPPHNPLIVHVDGRDMAVRYADVSPLAERMMDAFWPGPLTLVLPLRESAGLAPAVTAGLATLALRQPKGVMADLAGLLGVPIAAPSANTSGRLSPTTASHVVDDLGDAVDLVLDGGACDVGLESTILKVDGDELILLREGGATIEAIEAVFGGEVLRPQGEAKIEAPGQLLAHYAPRKPLRLNADRADPDEGWLVLGAAPDHAGPMQNLSPSGNLQEAAHNLFAMLKALDEGPARRLAVQPIPTEGLGAAINDRLARAAHGSNLSEGEEV